MFSFMNKFPIVKKGRSVEIAAARGEALGDDLGAVTGTSLDKGVELARWRRLLFNWRPAHSYLRARVLFTGKSVARVTWPG